MIVLKNGRVWIWEEVEVKGGCEVKFSFFGEVASEEVFIQKAKHFKAGFH